MSYTSERTKKREKELEAARAKAPAAWTGGNYKDALDAALDSLLKRESFSYDPGNDPLYKATLDRYQTMGKRAMEDTMGRAATLTGGYGNSYAATAGAQAYGDLIAAAGEEIPDLYAMAADRYNTEGQALYDQYALLSDRYGAEYDAFLAENEAWQAELDRLADALEASRDQDYKEYRDSVKDSQWQAEFEEDKRRYEEEKAAAAAKKSSSGGGSSKKSTKTKKETTKSGAGAIPTESLTRLKSKAAGGRWQLVEELNQLRETYRLTEGEYNRLYSSYYPYTPEARESAYVGQKGATGYYV